MELGEIVANVQDNETCLWNLVNGDGDGNDGNSGDCHGRETCLSSMAASEIWSTILKPRGANQEAAYWTPVFTLLAPLPGKTNQFSQFNKTWKKRIKLLSLLWFLRYLKRKTCLFQTKTKKQNKKLFVSNKDKSKSCFFDVEVWSSSETTLVEIPFFFNSRNIFQLTKHFCNSPNIFVTQQTFFQLIKHFFNSPNIFQLTKHLWLVHELADDFFLAIKVVVRQLPIKITCNAVW